MSWDRLTVAMVQEASGLTPEDNRSRLAELAPEGADLVVFPEAFSRDFGPAGDDVSGAAEPVDGAFGTELRRVATARGCAVLAGMFETSADPARPYNTLVLTGGPLPEPVTYRKIHLYDSFGYRESERLSAGPLEPVVADLGGVPVGLMTCYDLRFPELARRLVDRGAEVLVVPSAWVAGEGKLEHWRTLARARAIENTVYVVAVGQPAPRYTGHSLVVDPLGRVVSESGDGPAVTLTTLDRSTLVEARSVNPSLRNRRL